MLCIMFCWKTLGPDIHVDVFDMYHLPKHSCRPRTLFKSLVYSNAMNLFNRIIDGLTNMTGVDVASKFSSSQSDWASVRCTGQCSLIQARKPQHTFREPVKSMPQRLVKSMPQRLRAVGTYKIYGRWFQSYDWSLSVYYVTLTHLHFAYFFTETKQIFSAPIAEIAN